MKRLFVLAASVAFLLVSTPAFALRNETITGTTTFENGSVIAKPTATVDFSAAKDAVTPFLATATLKAASAGTAVTILPDGKVPAGKKVYVTGFVAKVDGATDWDTVTSVSITDSNATPVSFVTIALAALKGNSVLIPGSSDVTLNDALAKGSGGTTGKGLRVKADANGSGSDLVVTVFGVIK